MVGWSDLVVQISELLCLFEKKMKMGLKNERESYQPFVEKDSGGGRG